MKLMKRVLVLSLVILAVAAIHFARDRYTLSRGMPPGYYLECDGNGNYRPCRKSFKSPLVWTHGPGSKARAMRRAWVQYDFEYVEGMPGKWTPCE